MHACCVNTGQSPVSDLTIPTSFSSKKTLVSFFLTKKYNGIAVRDPSHFHLRQGLYSLSTSPTNLRIFQHPRPLLPSYHHLSSTPLRLRHSPLLYLFHHLDATGLVSRFKAWQILPSLTHGICLTPPNSQLQTLPRRLHTPPLHTPSTSPSDLPPHARSIRTHLSSKRVRAGAMDTASRVPPPPSLNRLDRAPSNHIILPFFSLPPLLSLKPPA